MTGDGSGRPRAALIRSRPRWKLSGCEPSLPGIFDNKTAFLLRIAVDLNVNLDAFTHGSLAFVILRHFEIRTIGWKRCSVRPTGCDIARLRGGGGLADALGCIGERADGVGVGVGVGAVDEGAVGAGAGAGAGAGEGTGIARVAGTMARSIGAVADGTGGVGEDDEAEGNEGWARQAARPERELLERSQVPRSRGIFIFGELI